MGFGAPWVLDRFLAGLDVDFGFPGVPSQTLARPRGSWTEGGDAFAGLTADGGKWWKRDWRGAAIDGGRPRRGENDASRRGGKQD